MKEKVQYHLFMAGVMAVLVVLFVWTANVADAETKVTWVCLGDAFHCQVTKQSGLGSFCQIASYVLCFLGIAAAFSWWAQAPKR